MARYFLDSSAFVKRYHRESGSSAVDDLFRQPGHQFFISRLALVEFHSAFARRVREGFLTVLDFEKLAERMDADLAADVVTVTALSSRRLEAAAFILRTHGLTNTVRSLDAIQLASAQALNARRRIAAFVAADKKLLVSAAACNLTALDVS